MKFNNKNYEEYYNTSLAVRDYIQEKESMGLITIYNSYSRKLTEPLNESIAYFRALKRISVEVLHPEILKIHGHLNLCVQSTTREIITTVYWTQPKELKANE